MKFIYHSKLSARARVVGWLGGWVVGSVRGRMAGTPRCILVSRVDTVCTIQYSRRLRTTDVPQVGLAAWGLGRGPWVFES